MAVEQRALKQNIFDRITHETRFACLRSRLVISRFEKLLESRRLDIRVQFFGIQRTRCFCGGNCVITPAVDTVIVLCRNLIVGCLHHGFPQQILR
jgi:hypothetical protein